jgi:digeranylgeranylglycerophospholipid reductase
MLEYDACIIGGGPVGGYIAGKISKNKFRVAIIEKNKEIGIPINCAGLITPRVFDLLDIKKDAIIKNNIKGANIHSPSGKILKIGGNKLHAYAIDRSKFDKEIIKKAKEKGAEVFLENNLLSAQKIDEHIEIKTSKKLDFKCNLLIGADGPYSKVRDRFAFPEPKEFLRGIGAELDGSNLDPDFVEIFLGNKIAPGFFAWIIPINENGSKARAGLCISRASPKFPKYYFSNLLRTKMTSDLIRNAKITKQFGGVIPLGALKRTYDSNVLLAGDAAAQVKPTSGGGIYTGILCAKHCSKVSIEAFEKNNFSSQFLKKYHKIWSTDIGKELNLGMKFRKIFKHFTDRHFDKYIEKFQNQKIGEIINKYGDIDYPSKLIKPMIKKTPSLLRLLPTVIKN